MPASAAFLGWFSRETQVALGDQAVQFSCVFAKFGYDKTCERQLAPVFCISLFHVRKSRVFPSSRLKQNKDRLVRPVSGPQISLDLALNRMFWEFLQEQEAKHAYQDHQGCLFAVAKMR